MPASEWLCRGAASRGPPGRRGREGESPHTPDGQMGLQEYLYIISIFSSDNPETEAEFPPLIAACGPDPRLDRRIVSMSWQGASSKPHPLR